MSYSRNLAIITAITEGTFTITQAAQHFHVSTRWITTLLHRYRHEGPTGLEPRSRRPHTTPTITPPSTHDTIIELRHQLTAQGLDAGPHTIYEHLPTDKPRPSPTTIWRILKKAGLITPQPQKRPRSSWQRFAANSPNETWQSDFTHWPLADGTTTEIISWLDDHSRYLLHISAHHRITTPIVITTFSTTADTHRLPASTLTDNGMVYTTRLSAGANPKRDYQPNGFENLLADLNIQQKNGRPSHPTTQGKIERFHQTLKRWLTAQPPAATLEELNTQLHTFATIYNTQRPHRALNRQTPATVYHATPKVGPHLNYDGHKWRIRYDKVDKAGKITIRYAGKLRHLGIGHAHKTKRVIALIHNADVIVINRETGQIIAEYTIDPTRNYQPKKTTPPHPNKTRTIC